MNVKACTQTGKKWFIITGGPGVGKTTLIKALQQQGYSTVQEDARRIIQEQLAINGQGVPWKNKALYASLMLIAALESYNKTLFVNKGITFFDRGILDTVCYMKMENIPLSVQMRAQIRECLYNKKVFMLPPWKKFMKRMKPESKTGRTRQQLL